MYLQASQYQKLLDEAPDKQAFLEDLKVKQIFVGPDKTALYHHEKGRKYRPNKRELESQRFKCPYCVSVTMKEVKLRKNEKGLTCPRCRWTIHRDDLWSPQPKEVPEAREPGDATDENLVQQPEVLEISLEEAVIPQQVNLR